MADRKSVLGPIAFSLSMIAVIGTYLLVRLNDGLLISNTLFWSIIPSLAVVAIISIVFGIFAIRNKRYPLAIFGMALDIGLLGCELFFILAYWDGPAFK